MLVAGPPHALILAGPASVGKTTLAFDLAAGLLCAADDPAARPCGTCRPCRLVASGEHQDLHVLAPVGEGRQVRIGDPVDPEPGTVRHLVRELSRLPVEGPRRVAIVEGADRLNEDAQNALLKSLEEPPPGAVLVLCADEPERLLPTVRSRAAVLRLGLVGIRALEELLAEAGVEPPRSARLARLADGRPGVALALAAAPQAVAVREELERSLVDLADAGTSARLVAGRELLARATELARGRREPFEAGPDSPSEEPGATSSPEGAREDDQPGGPGEREPKRPPSERRLAASLLIETWARVARDLAVVGAGLPSAVRDPAILDDLESTAARIPAGSAVAFLARVVRAAELLEANANPELLVDALVLAWPSATADPSREPA